MRFLANKTTIDFVGRRRAAYLLSSLMILATFGSLLWQGINFGIDFAGGTLVQVRFPAPVPPADVRAAMGVLGLGDVVIQEFGAPEEVLIRVEKSPEGAAQQELARTVVEALKPLAGDGGSVELRRVEFVGPQVGEELTEQGVLAMLYAMMAILAYISWRFELRFAVGAVVALVHDVIITIGFFSFTQKEFTLVVVAALLTVIGYSLNDTIVVFDRIREDMRRLKSLVLGDVINEAVNQTLSRTINTSLTVILVLVALLLFGGEVIADFAWALFVGVVVGTYSSIFVASPMVLALEGRSLGGLRRLTPKAPGTGDTPASRERSDSREVVP
ncbi:MAG: protein translocase subunit SecF [Magnetococcus sp. WYHC-3]